MDQLRLSKENSRSERLANEVDEKSMENLSRKAINIPLIKYVNKFRFEELNKDEAKSLIAQFFSLHLNELFAAVLNEKSGINFRLIGSQCVSAACDQSMKNNEKQFWINRKLRELLFQHSEVLIKLWIYESIRRETKEKRLRQGGEAETLRLTRSIVNCNWFAKRCFGNWWITLLKPDKRSHA